MAGDDGGPSGRPAARSSAASGPDEAAAYDVRPYSPGDREAYLALHRETLGTDSTPAWFAWKYERNPFVDEVPITVAERDGEFAGAVSAFPLAMHTGRREVPVYVSCEGFVHPDHRRRGLFTRLVGAAWDRYADRMAFVTGLSANEKTLAAHVKYNDWRVVSTVPRYYRFQRPDDLVRSRTESRAVGVLGRAAAPAVRGYLRLRSGRRSSDDAAVRVERHAEPPLETLTGLYREHVPRTIHAVRDERLYGWRFGNPHWEYTTYVADEGSPVAAVVAAERADGKRADGEPTEVRIVDVLPMDHGAVEEPLESLLAAALGDHADASFVGVLPGMLPEPALSRFGFVRQDRFPLSRLGNPIYHGVRQLTDDPAEDVRMARLADPANWRLSYLEHDAS